MKFVNVVLTKLLWLGLFVSSCNTHAHAHSVSVATKSRWQQSRTVSTDQFRPFSAEGWKPAATGDPERFLELPLIGMTSSPVEFAGAITWHSYDPAKWYYPPVFTPSYRMRLIENEVQTGRKQQTRHGLMPKFEHPPSRVPEQESP